MLQKKAVTALVLLSVLGPVQAGEKEELLKLRSTTESLIKQLVKQGILTEETAETMFKEAEAEAGKIAEQARTAAALSNAASVGEPDDEEVRVSYIPDFIKDQIRDEIRAELREDVTGDVISKAKEEGWGLADALPEWTRKFKLSGDMRLRYEPVFLSDSNAAPGPSYPNVQAINQLGGLTNAIARQEAFENTQTNNQRFRQRFRLGIEANIAEGLKAAVRLSTGNFRDPVSTNQTLGQTGDRYEFSVDRAYLQYDDVDSFGFNWLSLIGGRIKNPFFVGGGEFTGGSEMVWDPDLSFEGFAATYRYNLGLTNGLGDDARMIYATAGAFPLQEAPFSHNDKWLFGGQLGMNWGFKNHDSLKVAVAYYDYKNIAARPNSTEPNTCDLNNRENTASMPEFMQGGNSLATICYEGTQTAPTQIPQMLGLASDFNIVNVNMRYDMSLFDDIHLTFSGDYAKNIGFDSAKVAARRALGGGPIDEETTAWQVRADLGWLRVDKKGNWSTFVAYKRVERDAVLDAFTDSDFHLGGTNAKGWILGANYAFLNNVWLTSRWLSADAITGPPFAVDVFQFDINTKF
ncbi:MAG: putative porin [Gammaproteobacteria bacterium]|nr:putative porin [Gammaproteobacteria bacterium]